MLESNIHQLNDLRALDIRNNQLKSLTLVCEVITKIPRLEQLWIENNPCFGSGASARVRFFKRVRFKYSLYIITYSFVSLLILI